MHRGKSTNRVLLLIASLIFATLVTALVCCGTLRTKALGAIAAFTSFQTIVKHKREIMFYGDSMVTNLDLVDLKMRLEKEYERFEVTITQVGGNGVTLVI